MTAAPFSFWKIVYHMLGEIVKLRCPLQHILFSILQITQSILIYYSAKLMENYDNCN